MLDVKDIIPDFRLPNNMIVIEENLQKILSKSLVSITAGPSSAILESINLKTCEAKLKFKSGVDVINLIEDLDERKRLGQNARQKVINSYSLTDCLSKQINWVESLLN